MTSRTLFHGWLNGIGAVLLGILSIGQAQAQIFVDSGSNIAAYNTDGTVINTNLISSSAIGLATSQNNLFVGVNDVINEYAFDGTAVGTPLVSAVGVNGNPLSTRLAVSGNTIYASYWQSNFGTSAIGVYTTSGTTVNDSLITNLPGFTGDIVVSGSNLFIGNQGKVLEYTTSGTLLSSSFLGASNFAAFTILGNDLFAATTGGTIKQYNATTGALINGSFITGLPTDIMDLSSNENALYVLEKSEGTIGKYDATTGSAINASLVTGLNSPTSLTVVVTPEPSSTALLILGSVLLALWHTDAGLPRLNSRP